MTESGLNALFASFPVLTTERLNLRQVGADDAPDLFQVFSDPRVMEFYDLEPFDHQNQMQTLIARWLESFERHDGIRCGITLRVEHRVIGTVGLHVQSNWMGALGYELARQYWRMGIMTEALRAVVNCAFQKAEFERLEAHVVPGNEASSALLVKLGFQTEGLLRHFGYFRGAFQDLLCYSILSSDWVK